MLNPSGEVAEYLATELGADRVRTDSVALELHAYDASLEYGRPDVVVAPRDVSELAATVAAAHATGTPYVLRGAGTGYSGGALAHAGGLVVLTRHLDRLLEVDELGGRLRVEPGVVLQRIQEAAARAGWRYPPDPSSHQVCTIGGNVAENAGGPHALGAGSTAGYVEAVRLVRPDGVLVDLGAEGLDLRSLVVGSEGTLGAVAEATLRLVPAHDVERVGVAEFDDQEPCVLAVGAVLESGVQPSALDMLSGGFVPRRGRPVDQSVLYAGLGGAAGDVAWASRVIESCVRRHGGRYRLLDVAGFLQHRAELVREKVRTMVGATGLPRYYLFDAVVPRSRLADLMTVIREAAIEHDLPLLNTFHAGDGNVHPTPFYDPDDAGHRERLLAFSAQVLDGCAAMGGALSGEHGIGSEKRHLLHRVRGPRSLAVMRSIRRAFDPDGMANPGTMLPEPGAPATPAPATFLSPEHRLVVDLRDSSVELRAGVTFAEVAAALTGTPFVLPYVPLGGSRDDAVVACLDAGWPGVTEPWPIRTADLVVGASLRAPDGTSWEVGGRTPKDVGGFELRRILVGGCGRLGTVEAVRMRLWPRHRAALVARSEPGTVKDAVRHCLAWHRSRVATSYLGVLLDADGGARATARCDHHDRSATERFASVCAPVATVDPADSDGPWDEPVMVALRSCPAVVPSAPGAPWAATALLARLAGVRAVAFASVGHARTFWTGSSVDPPTPPGGRAAEHLTERVVAAFRDAR